MSNIIEKSLCLVLNRNWEMIGQKTVHEAIVQLCGSMNSGKATSLAMDIDYELDANGNPDTSKIIKMNPVDWDEWITLPIRSWDLTINSARMRIRVPTIIIAANYTKVPMRKFTRAPSTAGVYDRDGGICQYTGRKLSRHEANLDHVIPKSRGGENTWENVVLSDKNLNSKKGNKLNSEVGLKLIKTPKKPVAMPISTTIKEAKHVDWEFFIKKNT